MSDSRWKRRWKFIKRSRKRWLVASSILCRTVSRLSRQLHQQLHQPDEEMTTLARASYQARARVIDDHALDFYPVRSGNCIPLHSCRISIPNRAESLESSGGISTSRCLHQPRVGRSSPVEGCERDLKAGRWYDSHRANEVAFTR